MPGQVNQESTASRRAGPSTFRCAARNLNNVVFVVAAAVVVVVAAAVAVFVVGVGVVVVVVC